MDFPPTLFEKQVSEPFEPLERFVSGSDWLIVRQGMSGYVQRSSNKKSLGLFLMSSTVAYES